MARKARAHEARTSQTQETHRPARAEVAVARRYLEHGFLDAAIRLFVLHAAHTTPDDWDRLAGRVRERTRLRSPRPPARKRRG